MIRLEDYGWSPFFAAAMVSHAAAGLVPARVLTQKRRGYLFATAEGEIEGRVGGRLRHETRDDASLPVVGDWVAAENRARYALAHAVLPRRTAFTRKRPNSTDVEHVIAANLDRVIVVTGLDGDYSLERMERYLVLIRQSAAEPAFVLNKADLHPDAESCRREVEALSPGVPVLVTSAARGEGMEGVTALLQRGETGALLGSSGVGKSTILNAILGSEVTPVQEVRARDDKGRHTTTHREIYRLPGGGLLMDSPGLRELQLWGDAERVEMAFPEIEELAARCRFTDCGHNQEPGCAVREGLKTGELDARRYASYRKLQGELDHLNALQDVNAMRERGRRARTATTAYTRQARQRKGR